MASVLSHEEILRYSRHLLMPEVGLQGQKRLKSSSVLIIGTGGLGSPVALYLAAAGIGRIGLIDYDVVETPNLQRQVLHGCSTLGHRKVESARTRLQDLNPHVEIVTYDEPFTLANAMRIAAEYQVLVDGSDNFPTRYLTNDVGVLLNKPVVYGAIYRFEGQASVFYAAQGPCYRCLLPSPPPPHMVPSCAEGGVLGVLPGVIGTIQATETLKLLLGIGSSLIGRLLLYDALEMTFEQVLLQTNPACKICGESPEITAPVDYFGFCGVPGLEGDEPGTLSNYEIAPVELATRLRRGERIHLIDVREPHEQEITSLPGAELIPLGQLPGRLAELDPTEEIVLFCRSGMRSARALEILLSAGFRRIKHLQGGINAWARQVDPSLPVY